jgi:ubiquinone/menaquinone biosynthesis C-methylase UbiE
MTMLGEHSANRAAQLESHVRELIARILQCPDCQITIDAQLTCPTCRRSFVPAHDGIINAMPTSMGAAGESKESLQHSIEGGACDAQTRVVLYEQAFHDEQAPHYDRLFADPLPLRSYYHHLVHSQIYGFVRRAPFVIDLCCGTGKSSAPLLDRGLTVVGIDVSREMLRIYRAKWPDVRNPVLIHADASRPPLRPGSCPAVSMVGGLHHIPDRAGALDACCAALQPGGVLLLHEPLKTGRRSKIARLLENVYAITDPHRVRSAIRRRLGLPVASTSQPAEVEDFTPYERPFTSSQELQDVVPSQLRTLSLRGQGLLSFREFSPPLQRWAGRPLAALVVRADDWLSRTSALKWSGDALFGAFQKEDRPAR